MDLSKEQLIFLAGLISNHLSSVIEKKFEQIQKVSKNPTKPDNFKLIDRRIVAKQFNVTPDTISTWCRTGILAPSTYTIINRRFKFFKEKIDILLQQQKEGAWEPTKRYVPPP